MEFRPRLNEEEYNLIQLVRNAKKKGEHYQTGTWIVSGCWHFPFHNVKMFDSFLKIVNDLELRGFILNGDILDMHSISRHNKGKITIPGLTLEKEYNETNKILDTIDNVLENNVEKIFHYGNHCAWWSEYMSQVDAHKLGEGVVLSPKEALQLEKRNYKVQTNYKTAFTVVGDIEVIHGDYVDTHAAKKHLDVMKRNVMFNHTHRIQSYHNSNQAAYNIGWGGDKDAKVFSYMTRVQKEAWANGFAIIEVDSDGISHVTQLEFKNNKFMYNGKQY